MLVSLRGYLLRDITPFDLDTNFVGNSVLLSAEG